MKVMTFVLCVVLLFTANCCYKETDSCNEYVHQGPDYIHKLPGDYAISRASAFYMDFVRYINSDGTYYQNDIVLERISIWKYGYSKDDRFIFIHYFKDLTISETPTTFKYNGSFCKYEKEVFYLLDTVKGKEEIFSKYQDFIEFCGSNIVEFEFFSFPSAGESIQEKRVPINDYVFFSNRGDYLGQSLFVDNKMIFDGFIDEYVVLPNGLIGFHLIIADSDFTPEFNDANILLSIDRNQTNGKHFAGSFLVGFNIFYEKYIVYDSTDNSVLEFDKKKDLNKYIKNTFKTNIKWESIKR